MAKNPDTKNSLKTLKARNRKLVLNFMRTAGSVSINDISLATGLSKMTIHKIIDHYLDEGIIVLTGKGASTDEGGKKPNLFAFNPDRHYIFAIRFGNDCLSSSIVNLHGETIGTRKRIPIVNASFEEVVQVIADEFVEQVSANSLPKENCFAAVIGYNGVVDADTGECLTAYRNPGWERNAPIRESLRALLPDHVAVHVDSCWRQLAHSLAQHAEDGEGKTFFLIGNMGDCLSGGMVVDGQAFRGRTGFAGEVGHMIVAPGSAERCVCGGLGCLEALVAPGRVLGRARARFAEHPDSLVFEGDPAGSTASFHAIGVAADRGDALARELIDEVVGYFAIAINNIVTVCDPGRIVFFGDYARCGDYFLRTLRERADNVSMRGVSKRTAIDVSTMEIERDAVGVARHMTDRLFANK